MLNKKYLEEHRSDIETYDSIGRGVTDMVMQEAIEQIGDQDLDELEIDIKATVTKAEATQCVHITFKLPNGTRKTIHVKPNA